MVGSSLAYPPVRLNIATGSMPPAQAYPNTTKATWQDTRCLLGNEHGPGVTFPVASTCQSRYHERGALVAWGPRLAPASNTRWRRNGWHAYTSEERPNAWDVRARPPRAAPGNANSGMLHQRLPRGMCPLDVGINGCAKR
jgi:hypothetical protein